MTPRVVLAVVVVVACDNWSGADEPLHMQVDRLIQARAGDSSPAGPSDDAEFLRRIYLDLAGRIPSAREARSFWNDRHPDKRTDLIDRLLRSSEYSRRMAEAMDVMLMERRGDSPEWLAYLRGSFEQNKSAAQLTREILQPNATNSANGSAFFLTKRLEKYGENPIDYPGLTRDVGRFFLGVDLQCAQCHDHLFVQEYKQRDFQGLFTIFQNLYLRPETPASGVAEKLMTQKLEFASVFDKEKKQVGPRIPGGDEFEIPTFAKGEEYREPPDPKTRRPGVPRFSPLALLAERLPATQNAAFARNVVNRIWFLFLGRGLVHPLDQHHRDNPPSHPELLDLLAREFTAHGYDMKWLVAELVRTSTYQRTAKLADSAAAPRPEQFLLAHEKSLSAEQLLWSVLQATGSEDCRETPLCPTGQTVEKLRERFVKAFANPPGEPEVEFSPSLRAALFFSNDAILLECLRPQPGNLIDRLSKISDAKAIADETYVSILTRTPNEIERAEFAEYLEKHAGDPVAALRHVAWAFLASSEFCINH